MKLKKQLIFASLFLVSASVLLSACDNNKEDWHPDYSAFTDESHGSLTNHNVVATGEVRNVTQNSATILCSANYNYKNSLHISRPGVVYSDIMNEEDDLAIPYNYVEWIDIDDFTSSEYEVTLNDLKPSTTYYYRAYASSGGGHWYGEIKSFTTSLGSFDIEAVDLGLSVKWANVDIGASHPEETGDRFNWGGIDACESSCKADWHDFTLSTMKSQGYIDGNNNLCSSYDAASQIWGSKWRMPTKDEFQELIDKCSWDHTRKNGREAYLITGPNGNVIYLPVCDHWSSTGSSNISSYLLRLDYPIYQIDYNIHNRSKNYCIRPVVK